MKITLLSSLFKYFNIQKTVINKNTLKLYAVFLIYHLLIRNE
jgi:hypothetical protein